MKHIKLFEAFVNEAILSKDRTPENDERFEKRKKQLLDLGFKMVGPDFDLKDVWSVYWEQVYMHDDKWWGEYVEDIKKAIKEKDEKI